MQNRRPPSCLGTKRIGAPYGESDGLMKCGMTRGWFVSVSLRNSRMVAEGRVERGPQPPSRVTQDSIRGGPGAEPPAARDINVFNER